LSGIISIPAIGFGHGLSGWALFTAPGSAIPRPGLESNLEREISFNGSDQKLRRVS
jgi:hypothetical protein